MNKYKVKQGDTLMKIALDLGDAKLVDEIKKLNDLNSDTLYPEQKLRLPDVPKKTNIYEVNKGDNLWKIASEYLGDGERYRDIMKLNNLTDVTIHETQKLELPRLESIHHKF